VVAEPQAGVSAGGAGLAVDAFDRVEKAGAVEVSEPVIRHESAAHFEDVIVTVTLAPSDPEAIL
jgi:hypothetical protein